MEPSTLVQANIELSSPVHLAETAATVEDSKRVVVLKPAGRSKLERCSGR